ncbi:MAG: alanyl-tRNA editing protein [Alkalispirochaeta sp.]
MTEIGASFYRAAEDVTLLGMTHPGYYDNPLADTFETTVAMVEGDGRAVVLSETFFYPEGGGQPADTGVIAGNAVIDVQKDETGVIRHYLESSPDTPLERGTTVTGHVDMNHRWDYMQQHTGQHVLSAALEQVAEAPTVSVHQGSDVTTIEVDTETLDDSLLEAVEDRANAIVRSDLPVRGFWIDHSELANYTLRRPTSRTGRIRLVKIEGVDLVACGGVHLPRTGLLNLIHLASVERIRGRLRLGFKIGDRALRDYRTKDRLLSAAAEHFSAHPADLPERIYSMVSEVQELHRTRRLQARRIAECMYAAAETAARGEETLRTVRLNGEDQEVFTSLAEVAAERVRPGEKDRDGGRPRPIGACILNQTESGLHWALATGITPFPQEQLRSGLLEPLRAKGGGKPPLWRGIIKEFDSGTAEQFVQRLQETLRAL